MLFELSLSDAVVDNLMARRFAQLERICLTLPPPGTPILFNRVDLKGLPTFVGITEPGAITLADGSSITINRVRLRVTQQFDVYFAMLTPDLLTLGPASGSLDLKVTTEIDDGTLFLCTEFENLNFSVAVEPDQLKVVTDTLSSMGKTCMPIPMSDLLNQLTATLPQAGSVFHSTDVLNAGLGVTGGSHPRLLIRIEVDQVDKDAQQRWTAFHHGQDSPMTDLMSTKDWTLTVDRRLFSRMISSTIAAIDANSNHDGQPGTLDLSSPSIEWHSAQDLWGIDTQTFPPKWNKIADDLPTLIATIDGTAVDVCPGWFQSSDIDFTATLMLAFEVPELDVLRLYAGVTVDASDWDEFKCGLNLTSILAGPLYFAMGPFGIFVAVFVAAVMVSMAGDSFEMPPQGPQCHQEYQYQVCDMHWSAQTSFGFLHLDAVSADKDGLVLMGPTFGTPWKPAPIATAHLLSPFAWNATSCDPIDDLSDLRARAAVGTGGAPACDARIIDDKDDAYWLVFTPGTSGADIWCTKTVSEAPTYPCRVLLATNRGLVLAIVPAPPSEVSLDEAKARQQIVCKVYPSEGRRFRRWPEPDPAFVELVDPELALVVLEATVAGLKSGQVIHLLADGTMMAAAITGPLGSASVSAALEPDSVGAEFAIVPADSARGAAGSRSALSAHLEFWRHAGEVAVIGSIQDVTVPSGGRSWIATSYGLLQLDLQNDKPATVLSVPRSGARRLAMTDHGMFVAGDKGLDLLDAESGRHVARLADGSFSFVAQRGSVLYAAGDGAVQVYSLRWTQDARGRDSTPDFQLMGRYPAAQARSGALCGRFLVLESTDGLEIHELDRTGAIVSVRTARFQGLSDVQKAVGADTHDAVVALIQKRPTIVRIDSLGGPREARLQTLELSALPWSYTSWRTGTCLLRLRRSGSTIDVFRLLYRVDMVKREARFESLRGQQPEVGAKKPGTAGRAQPRSGQT